MPTVLREGPYRFHFYAVDRDERPHIHVERDHASAKFWLDQGGLASARGFREIELRRLGRLVQERQVLLLGEWYGYFAR